MEHLSKPPSQDFSGALPFTGVKRGLSALTQEGLNSFPGVTHSCHEIKYFIISPAPTDSCIRGWPTREPSCLNWCGGPSFWVAGINAKKTVLSSSSHLQATYCKLGVTCSRPLHVYKLLSYWSTGLIGGAPCCSHQGYLLEVKQYLAMLVTHKMSPLSWSLSSH